MSSAIMPVPPLSPPEHFVCRLIYLHTYPTFLLVLNSNAFAAVVRGVMSGKEPRKPVHSLVAVDPTLEPEVFADAFARHRRAEAAEARRRWERQQRRRERRDRADGGGSAGRSG